jgi:CDP-glucose 4,6-dehydratase
MDLKLGSHLRELPGPVLVTGHTGFKGTWLTFLLERLGVPVVGFSLAPEQNSLFDRANRTGAIPETFSDIRDFSAVLDFMSLHHPSAVIHMAAQPFVLESYEIPRETFETNVMGTVNTLDSAFKTDSVMAVVVVTTDKVYRNDNSGHSFVESDALAGKDPYSASKVGTEAVVAAWQQISKISGGPKVLSVRAGNVIGGGDWAKDRLIPDLVRGFISGGPIQIRNPNSTRPWQHVLDPLRGYLMALEALLGGQEIQTLNFGPEERSRTVREVLMIAQRAWKQPVDFEIDSAFEKSHDAIESIALDLNSSFAHSLLGWRQEDAVVASLNWWKEVLEGSMSAEISCQLDINHIDI